ncbi:zinc finger protein 251-like [Plectropomus leopardus]|uniref:zinc finger protein 251-like n=1 Tax=Plectropomus leopardus TaxID=160734 RepID=UPI001C4AFACE|nr:zinc finger protein 251-like [Plectropomus leopardus]
MSSLEYLREFVNQRLTAAAEEIFGVFKRSIVEYEEELSRQRRLLENICKPEIKSARTEFPQQHVCHEEEVLADQQELCTPGRSSSLDQEDPEPPLIKEEQEELCINQEGEQLLLKEEETDTFMFTPAYEENDHCEDQTLYLSADERQTVVGENTLSYISVVNTVVSEQNMDLQLLSHNYHVAESRDHTGGQHGDSGSSTDAEPEQHHRSSSHTFHVYDPTMPTVRRNANAHDKSFKCEMCERVFKSKSHLQRHMTIHTGEKPFSCKICGKDFRHNSTLKVHIRTHTGEKPYFCKFCGKRFCAVSPMKRHMRVHTVEKKLHTCQTCGKSFCQSSDLKDHMRIHTGEKPFKCEKCGRSFRLSGHLMIHIRAHAGERPHVCKICGNRYFRVSHLLNHMETHKGE